MGIQITALDTALLRVPTGTRWAGFGVTELEVVHVTVTDADGATGTGFTFSVSGGAVAMRSLVEGLIGQATVGSELEGGSGAGMGCGRAPIALAAGSRSQRCRRSTSPSGTCAPAGPGCRCTGCWAPTATRC